MIYNLFSFSGSYMYTGNLNGLYTQQEMMSPYLQTDRQLCVEFYYALIRPHEYSSTFLTIHQNISFVYREVFSLIEYRKDVTQQWHRAQFPVAAGYFNLRFYADGHRSIIAIDDILLYEGNCPGKSVAS
jgi:hypothetical protein